MKLLWFLLSAAVMVQARPDSGPSAPIGGAAEPEPKFVVTEDGIKPNPNVVEQDSLPVIEVYAWTEDGTSADPGNRVEATSEIASSMGGQKPTSNIINIDVTKPITAELSINFHQVQDPAPKPEPTCIHNWGYCQSSNKPCCGQKKLEDGTFGPKYWTCDEFGQGVCTPLHRISNLGFFAELVSQLNSTNWRELHDKYWQSVPQVY